ncbi:hypothetical protein [Gemmatimonas sp.]|uniref:hypothetical protein n=1 Tax=Gemmatimonas sp. TaxID=1962908 RepID=UPI0039834865
MGAAAIVLVVAPALIAGAVGLSVDADDAFAYDLLAASELGLAVLCLTAQASKDTAVERAAVIALIVFHAASGFAGVRAWLHGADVVVLLNVGLRVVMVVAFAVLGLRRGRAPNRA